MKKNNTKNEKHTIKKTIRNFKKKKLILCIVFRKPVQKLNTCVRET